jgi:hypothetical protein
MKRFARGLLIWTAFASLACGPVFAAVDISQVVPGNAAGNKLEKPPQQMPLMPKAEPPPSQAREVTIPELPPSLPCKQKWLFGLWELKRVFESPLGTETAAYNENPVQYIGFRKDTRFFRYNAGKTRMDPQEVYKIVNSHSGALLQHLLQDGGMLYIYQDSVATDTLVCFVVAESRPPYGAGNLILMPPKGQVAGRLIKIYRKVWPPKVQQPQNPPPGPRGRPQRRFNRQQGR